jgi:integration host factor subunit beta
MTKRNLSTNIAQKLGISQVTATQAVRLTLHGIVEVLATEGRIELRNFGVFTAKRRRPRMARNPRTGVAVSVPERIGVSFKPGLEMQERIAKSNVAVEQSAQHQTGLA